MSDTLERLRERLDRRVALQASPSSTAQIGSTQALLSHRESVALLDIAEAAQEAEVQASKAHDAIYREPVDREAANDAIWAIHNALRPALAALDSTAEEPRATRGLGPARQRGGVNICLCPKCGGQRHVAKPPHIAGDQRMWVDYNTGGYRCPVCKGVGYLVLPADSEERG